MSNKRKRLVNVKHIFKHWVTAIQPAFTCSESVIDKPEKCVKYVASSVKLERHLRWDFFAKIQPLTIFAKSYVFDVVLVSFVVNFEQTSHIVQMFPLQTLNK